MFIQDRAFFYRLLQYYTYVLQHTLNCSYLSYLSTPLHIGTTFILDKSVAHDLQPDPPFSANAGSSESFM